MLEWDEEKRQANLAQHGIDFADCAPIFAADMWVVEDTSEDYGEQRMIGIGLLNGIEVLVVYTERDAAIRLISVRKATKHEARFYWQSITGH
jgi:uncharacterized protein